MSTMTLEQVRDVLRATADHADSGYDKAWAIRLADAIDAYLREREALKRDAERWRGARSCTGNVGVYVGVPTHDSGVELLLDEEADQAIDDAMAKELGE